MPTEPVRIYTDGACSGNPGPGGWSAILIWNDRVLELSGRSQRTTNNIMELTAAIRALERLKRPVNVELYTDSSYLVKGMTEWLPKWQEKGWRRKGGTLKNVELWKRLARLARMHRISWQWVRGHAGDPYNERADRLAREAVLKA